MTTTIKSLVKISSDVLSKSQLLQQRATPQYTGNTFLGTRNGVNNATGLLSFGTDAFEPF